MGSSISFAFITDKCLECSEMYMQVPTTSSDLRQEFTGMLRHTCNFCWSEGLNGFVISIFLGSAEQTITEDAGFGLLTELAAN